MEMRTDIERWDNLEARLIKLELEVRRRWTWRAYFISCFQSLLRRYRITTPQRPSTIPVAIVHDKNINRQIGCKRGHAATELETISNSKKRGGERTICHACMTTAAEQRWKKRRQKLNGGVYENNRDNSGVTGIDAKRGG